MSSPGTNPSLNPHACEGPPPAEELLSGPGVPPLIQQAHEAFRRDLGQLLDERPGEWVAYHGTARIGVGSSKAILYQQ
jgi:hypothetical protein